MQLNKVYLQVCDILRLVQDFEYTIKEAQYFENLDAIPRLDDYLAANFMNTLQGEKLLIEAYQVIFDNNQNDLNAFVKGLESMYRQNYFCQNILKDQSDKKDYLINEIREKLKTDKEAYLSCINEPVDENGVYHYNIIKYFEEDGGYYRTFYNTGLGIMGDSKKLDEEILNQIRDTRLIYSALKYPYNSVEEFESAILKDISISVNTADLLESEAEGSTIRKEQRRLLPKATPANDKRMYSQKTSNCMTRCCREALRDNVDPKTFSEIFDFITNTKYSSILEMLEYKKKAFEQEFNIEPVEVKNLNNFNPSLDSKESYQKIFKNEIDNRLGIALGTEVKNNKLVEILEEKSLNEKIFLAKHNAQQLISNERIIVANNTAVLPDFIPIYNRVIRGLDTWSTKIVQESSIDKKTLGARYKPKFTNYEQWWDLVNSVRHNVQELKYELGSKEDIQKKLREILPYDLQKALNIREQISPQSVPGFKPKNDKKREIT